MANFQELQAEKKTWNLANDETFFEKLKQLSDNVMASTSLVHNSINEAQKGVNAAQINLNNTINAFNNLSFSKFVENVVEEQEEDLYGGGPRNMADNLGLMDQTTMMGDVRPEDEKLAEALQIALEEINQAKEEKREAMAQDDEGMMDAELTKSQAKEKKKEKKEKEKAKLKDYLGVSKVIKLPFIIGTDEYKKHPFAGVVFIGDQEDEQVDLHNQEVD